FEAGSSPPTSHLPGHRLHAAPFEREQRKVGSRSATPSEQATLQHGRAIEPVVKERVTEGYSENLLPLLRREPLEQSAKQLHRGRSSRRCLSCSPSASCK